MQLIELLSVYFQFISILLASFSEFSNVDLFFGLSSFVFHSPYDFGKYRFLLLKVKVVFFRAFSGFLMTVLFHPPGSHNKLQSED